MPILETHTERQEFLFVAKKLLAERVAGTVLPKDCVQPAAFYFGG